MIYDFFKVPADDVYDLLQRDVASIVLIIRGQCKINDLVLSIGKVFMIPANAAIKIHVGSEVLELYQAFANV